MRLYQNNDPCVQTTSMEKAVRGVSIQYVFLPVP